MILNDSGQIHVLCCVKWVVIVCLKPSEWWGHNHIFSVSVDHTKSLANDGEGDFPRPARLFVPCLLVQHISKIVARLLGDGTDHILQWAVKQSIQQIWFWWSHSLSVTWAFDLLDVFFYLVWVIWFCFFLFPALFLEKLNLSLIIWCRQMRSVWYSVIHDSWSIYHFDIFPSWPNESFHVCKFGGYAEGRCNHGTRTVGRLGSCFARNRMLGIARVLESNNACCMISSLVVVLGA